MNERKGSIPGKISGELFLHTVRIDIQNPERFDAPREHLKTGSILMYFPHFAKLDAIVYGKVIRENLVPLDHATCMVAMKYLDPKRNKIQSELMHSWEKAFGLTVLPLVQTKDRESYPNPKKINIPSLFKAVDLLNQPGNVVGVAPEGTRSNTGQIQEAEQGFELLLKRSRNVMALPVAAIHGRVLPLITNTRVIIGEGFSYEEIQAEKEANPQKTVTDLAMLRLAALLPEENRGFYR